MRLDRHISLTEIFEPLLLYMYEIASRPSDKRPTVLACCWLASPPPPSFETIHAVGLFIEPVPPLPQEPCEGEPELMTEEAILDWASSAADAPASSTARQCHDRSASLLAWLRSDGE